MNRRRLVAGLGLVLLCTALQQIRAARTAGAPAAGQDLALKAADVRGKLFPDKVFFRGKLATVEPSNTAGFHFGDDAYVLVGLVDSSGYASNIRGKYQGYLISEVTLEIGGQKLAPGAYGVGFVGGKFMVMDLGAHDALQAASTKDTEIKRPVPIQVLGGAAGKFRLYFGREFVEAGRAQ